MASNIRNMLSVLRGMEEVMYSEDMNKSVWLWGVADEFERLRETMSIIRAILLDAESILLDAERKQEQNEGITRDLERVEDVVYEAYDLVDYFSAVALGRRSLETSRNKIATKVRSFFSLSSSNPFVFRRKMGYAIKKILRALDEAASSDILRKTMVVRATERVREETFSFVISDEIIGREPDKGKILELVLEAVDAGSTEQKLKVVPVVGVGGIGKTTLAGLVYNEDVVAQHFDLKLWVCIDNLADTRFIVQKLVSRAKWETVHQLHMDKLQKELRKTINGKRFFLVLDGVHDGSRENWLSLRNLLLGGAEGSTVLVTTRSEKIANITRTVAQSYHLGPLDDADSWLLLKRIMAIHGEQTVQGLEEIGRQVAGKCKGVPLLIKHVGSYLGIVDMWERLDPEEIISIVKSDYGLEVNEDQEAKFSTAMREQSHSFVPQEKIIGRDADKEEIMKQLLDYNSEVNELMVIAIVGAAGVGKTALAQLIVNDAGVQDHFELSIWVCVTRDFDLEDIMTTIVASVTNEDQRDYTLEELSHRLRQGICGKRYLLVLDDVWNETHEKWRDLRYFLSVGAYGSRVIVTTRNEDVATMTAGKDHTYKLESLDKESSWSLFVKVAFEKGQEPTNSEIKEIGEKIVANCGGIPLAIRTIGGMLYFKNAVTEWRSFYEKELPKILKEPDMLASLKLSYDDLPYKLKLCFAHCALFPKDYEIDVQTLVNLWMSLGFIESNSRSYSHLEDWGYEYFVDLLRRSFFQETMRDEWGRITKCKMQTFMCDLARLVAPKVYATLGLKGGNNGTQIHHVSFDFHLDSSWHIRLLGQSKRIRSLILPRQLRQEVEGRSTESVCEEVTKFKYLRMLDLHNSGIKVVPDTIGDLIFLRYLDLSQNLNIKALPKSIGRLQNLQTLKLNHCSNLQKFPGAITKLVNLRSLENESCYCLTHMPQRLSQLSNLRTLSEFVLSKDIGSVSNKSAKLDELAELNKLSGKLKIKNLSCLAGDMTTKAILNQKQHLVSLALIWDIDATITESACENLLEVLQPPTNLRELSLSAYGGVKFSSWLPLHENLVKFSLSRSTKCQCLPPLDHLPRLKVLLVDELPELVFISDKMAEDESRAFFQSLKELQLTNLPKLSQWWKHAADNRETAFPHLSKLIIKDCPNLNSLPLFPCLEELLVLKNTRWEPFQATLEACQIPRTTTEASSSTSSTIAKMRALCVINMPNGGPKMWESLTCLRCLTLDHLQDMETFLDGLEEVTNLQELHIWRCDSLKEISWIRKITSLRKLSLRLCPNLTIPREEISIITSLQKVEIEECPQVSHIERMLEDRLYRRL